MTFVEAKAVLRTFGYQIKRYGNTYPAGFNGHTKPHFSSKSLYEIIHKDEPWDWKFWGPRGHLLDKDQIKAAAKKLVELDAAQAPTVLP